jgi:hypothetical protein
MRQWWPMPETIGPQRVLGSDWDRRILDYGVEIADILRDRIQELKGKKEGHILCMIIKI